MLYFFFYIKGIKKANNNKKKTLRDRYRRVGHCDASPEKNVGRYPPNIHGHFKVTDTSNASHSTHHVNIKTHKILITILSSAIFRLVWCTRCHVDHISFNVSSGNIDKLPHTCDDVDRTAIKRLPLLLHSMCMFDELC